MGSPTDDHSKRLLLLLIFLPVIGDGVHGHYREVVTIGGRSDYVLESNFLLCVNGPHGAVDLLVVGVSEV